MTKKMYFLFASLILATFITMPVNAEPVALDSGLTYSVDQSELTSPPADIQKAPEKAYGDSLWNIYTAGACDATYRGALGNYIAENCVSVYPDTGESWTDVGFPIHIPTGAVIEYVRIWYYDDTTATDPGIGLWAIDEYGGLTWLLDLSPDNFSGGDRMQQFGPIAHTVDNYYNTYVVLAVLNRSGSLTERIYKVMIYYRLQVTPAPGTATFPDVWVGHWAHQYVEAIVNTGVVSGKPDGLFHPSDPITRAEMAKLIAQLLGLSWEY